MTDKAENAARVIGRNIKRLRGDRNLGQHELAKLIDVAQPTVSLWESGACSPRAAMLFALAKALRCNVSDLTSGKA